MAFNKASVGVQVGVMSEVMLKTRHQMQHSRGWGKDCNII